MNDLSGLSVPAAQPASGAQLEVKPATLLALSCDFVGTRPASLETNELLYFFFFPFWPSHLTCGSQSPDQRQNSGHLVQGSVSSIIEATSYVSIDCESKFYLEI